jgi:hypothetical protein
MKYGLQKGTLSTVGSRQGQRKLNLRTDGAIGACKYGAIAKLFEITAPLEKAGPR